MLQREPAKVTLWGWGTPGAIWYLRDERGNLIPAEVDAGGQWRINLPPQPTGPAFGSGNLSLCRAAASGPPACSADTAGRIKLTDVSFGEVWLCAGQSNMGVSLSQVCTGADGNCPKHLPLTNWAGDVSDGPAEIANASAYPMLRLAFQKAVSLPEPTAHADLGGNPKAGGAWFVPSPENMAPFSAVCWMFGRRLQAALGETVPLGLIQNQVGGTAVELWSSPDALGRCDQNRNASNINPTCTLVPEPPKNALRQNSSLFNGMINPWINTAVRGAIWYQGEVLL